VSWQTRLERGTVGCRADRDDEELCMARVPIEDGFFRIPDDPDEPPRLLGSSCPACGEVFFPRRMVCARCLHEGTDDVELSTRGRIWTWTYCHVPMFGGGRLGARSSGAQRSEPEATRPPVEEKKESTGGYGVGQVDLPEGPRVQSILLGGPDDFEVGMEVELDLEVLREDRDGNEVVIYRFRPVTDDGRPAVDATGATA
jgi:uncharacterized OB-fold protein